MVAKHARRRAPQKSNSKARVARLLHTTGEMLDDVGPAGFNTIQLCDRAGTAVGSFYQYFSDKADIIEHYRLNLAEKFLTNLEAEIASKDPYIFNFANALTLIMPAMVDTLHRTPGCTHVAFPVEQTLVGTVRLLTPYAVTLTLLQLVERVNAAVPIAAACVTQTLWHPQHTEYLLGVAVRTVEALAADSV